MKNLVILAGGKSSRMGRDKVLLELNGMTFIERIFFNALVCFDRIIISTDTKEHADRIAGLPLFAGADRLNNVYPEFVLDIYPGVGPMGAIRSVFESTDVSRFSIISVDVPFADMKVLDALYDRCTKKACFLKIADRRSEPLIAAYDRSGYPDICRCMDAGLLKMRRAFEKDDITVVTDSELKSGIQAAADLDFDRAFANYNTPEEFGSLN